MTERVSLAGGYEEAYEQLNKIPQQLDPQEVTRFADLCSDLKGSDVLDLGCAEGQLSVALALRGHRVIAADISQAFLEKAAKAASDAGATVRFERLDIEGGMGSLTPGSIDCVYFMDVIEHLRNPIAGLLNIHKLLRDNGRLIIHTPNAVAIRRLWWGLRHRRTLIDYYDFRNLEDLHFQTYDYLTLEKTLNFVGFRVTSQIPTKAMLPAPWRMARVAERLSYRIARAVPHFSDTLLVTCSKHEPLDVAAAIEFWERRGARGFH